MLYCRTSTSAHADTFTEVCNEYKTSLFVLLRQNHLHRRRRMGSGNSGLYNGAIISALKKKKDSGPVNHRNYTTARALSNEILNRKEV